MNMYITGLLRPVFYLLTLSLLLLISLTKTQAQGNPTLPTLSLSINQTSLTAELASTDKQRALGLMWRTELAPNSGMLFVFDETTTTCFWMKNTPLPLSIAFITHEGVISNIEQMQPFSTWSHCPITAIKYALEMEQGWFSQHAISAGDTIEGLPKPIN